MKKAQAAMEFLMTYGWALLVVLVAIGALAYFGLTNPTTFLPDQCLLATGFHCSSSFATANAGASNPVTLSIQNEIGYQITGFTVAVTDTAGTPLTSTAADCVGTPQTVGYGQSVTCGYQLPAGTGAGSQLKGQVTLTWADVGGNIHSRTGNLALTVEP